MLIHGTDRKGVTKRIIQNTSRPPVRLLCSTSALSAFATASLGYVLQARLLFSDGTWEAQ